MVNKENIRCFVTFAGTIVGEWDGVEDSNFVKLKHSFRVQPTQDAKVAVGALFVKEEWSKIPINSAIEIDVSEGVAMLYMNYESELYGSVLLPPEKKIIL